MIGTEIVGGVTTLNKNAKEALGFNSETGKYSRRRELVALRCGFYNELISREFSGASEKGWKKMERITGQDHSTVLHICSEENTTYYRENKYDYYLTGAKIAMELFPVMNSAHEEMLDNQLSDSFAQHFKSSCQRFGRYKGLRLLQQMLDIYGGLYGQPNLNEAIDELNSNQVN